MMERDRGLLFHTGLSDKVASEQRTEPSDAEVMKPHKENSGGGGEGITCQGSETGGCLVCLRGSKKVRAARVE